jgi:predicted nucleic-acid-binding Zn-ribbon protein
MNNSNMKKCPKCRNNMELIQKEGSIFPQSFDEHKKEIIWSSCSVRIFRYSYWQCKICSFVEINEVKEK